MPGYAGRLIGHAWANEDGRVTLLFDTDKESLKSCDRHHCGTMQGEIFYKKSTVEKEFASRICREHCTRLGDQPVKITCEATEPKELDDSPQKYCRGSGL
jgi:hypothetical protein